MADALYWLYSLKSIKLAVLRCWVAQAAGTTSFFSDCPLSQPLFEASFDFRVQLAGRMCVPCVLSWGCSLSRLPGEWSGLRCGPFCLISLPQTRLGLLPPIIESRNHRIVGVGRDLCGSSSPTLLPKQGHLQQAAQDPVQAALEYL